MKRRRLGKEEKSGKLSIAPMHLIEEKEKRNNTMEERRERKQCIFISALSLLYYKNILLGNIVLLLFIGPV